MAASFQNGRQKSSGTSKLPAKDAESKSHVKNAKWILLFIIAANNQVTHQNSWLKMLNLNHILKKIKNQKTTFERINL